MSSSPDTLVSQMPVPTSASKPGSPQSMDPGQGHHGWKEDAVLHRMGFTTPVSGGLIPETPQPLKGKKSSPLVVAGIQLDDDHNSGERSVELSSGFTSGGGLLSQVSLGRSGYKPLGSSQNEINGVDEIKPLSLDFDGPDSPLTKSPLNLKRMLSTPVSHVSEKRARKDNGADEDVMTTPGCKPVKPRSLPVLLGLTQSTLDGFFNSQAIPSTQPSGFSQ